MALTSGFYNSVSGDRKYDALQMSSLFEGIIVDGVFPNVGTSFAVTRTGVLTIGVGSGRAWFNKTWTNNDTVLPLTLPAASGTLNRYDAVVLKIDTTTAVRANSIYVKQGVGTTGTNPAKPALTKSGGVYEYALAYIYRKAASTDITQANIQYLVGTAATPIVTAPLKSMTIEPYVAQMRGEFDIWMAALNVILSGDAETNLAAAVVALQTRATNTEAVDEAQDTSLATLDASLRLTDALARMTEKRRAENQTSFALDIKNVNERIDNKTFPERRHTYRGKSLGSRLGPTQLLGISTGTFIDLWLGDYLEVGGLKWRIVDFNYFRGFGQDDPFNLSGKNHIVLMPDYYSFPQRMHSTNATAGGFNPSEMNKVNIKVIQNSVAKYVAGMPGLSLASFSEWYTNGPKADGSQSIVLSSQPGVMIPTETMIFGTSMDPSDRHTYGNTQLALFRERRDFIKASNDANYWTRSVVNSQAYRIVGPNGMPNGLMASTVAYVRPIIVLVRG